jgi:DNA-directed RNA polymerase
MDSNLIATTELQLQVETDMLTEAADRYRNSRGKSSVSDSRVGSDFVRQFIDTLASEIEAEQLRNTGGSVVSKRPKYALPLLALDAFKQALITLRSLLNATSLTEAPTLLQVAQEIGRSCFLERQFDLMKEREKSLYDLLIRRSLNPSIAKRRALAMMAKFSASDWSKDDLDLHLGSRLIYLAANSTGAFTVKHLRSSKNPIKTPAVIVLSDAARSWLEQRDLALERWASPLYLPMIAPPADWTNLHNGGYLSNQRTLALPIVKHRGNRRHLEALREQDLGTVFSAVNALQKTPWRLNGYILSCLTEAVKRGCLPNLKENESSGAKAEEASLLLRHQKRLASDGVLYFPHQLDRRGRVYPLPQILNPQGSDMGRALLEFADGKGLGCDGEYWLMVHVANCYGHQRLSFDQRLKWIKDSWVCIQRMVTDPFGEFEFWSNADKPWEFLASARELCNYREQGSSFVSFLPVSVDGTCNGLQHLSAIARDLAGGLATNLIPGEAPQDIYQRVADLAKAHVERDALRGNELARPWTGAGIIRRKLAKPATMTTPYGVKRAGIQKQLSNDERVRKAKIPWNAIVYMAGVLEENIKSVVVSASKVMSWLQDVARILSGLNAAPCWTTPSGFRVLHEYPRERVRRIATVDGTLQIRDVDENGRLDTRKQVNAIVPNFTHSLDAAHMVLTINRLLSLGVTHFTMVHDSYGCHACDISRLNVALRETFVEIYRDSIITKLLIELGDQFPLIELPEPPPEGSLSIESVLESPYFFS